MRIWDLDTCLSLKMTSLLGSRPIVIEFALLSRTKVWWPDSPFTEICNASSISTGSDA